MKTLYLDLFAGVSGDMLLGLLVDLGVPVEALREGLNQLRLPISLEARAGMKGAIGGTKVELVCADQADDRNLSEIREIIDGSDLPARVKERAVRVFTRLAEAEARVHRMPVDQVHFHEVGALDAIGDVVGVVLGLELLGVEKVVASALPTGRGFVECRHGRIPLPAPAVVELAVGWPLRELDLTSELTTPTGAALVTTLGEYASAMPLIAGERVGYGLGTRDLAIPNAVRGVLGQASGAADRVVELEANIDDLNPQVYGYVSDQLFAAGALDVWLTPIQMKKGRPGTKLSVLCEENRKSDMASLIFSETSTLGVRMTVHERIVLERRTIEVATRFGTIRAKVAAGRLAPEYDDCVRAAGTHRVALRDVYEEVRARGAGQL